MTVTLVSINGSSKEVRSDMMVSLRLREHNVERNGRSDAPIEDTERHCDGKVGESKWYSIVPRAYNLASVFVVFCSRKTCCRDDEGYFLPSDECYILLLSAAIIAINVASHAFPS